MHRYTVSTLIGEGSFGRVYKAMRKEDAQVVAIKVISKRGRTTRELKNLRRECDIQAQLKHPNVIEMLESFETRSDILVVTEFALIDLHRYMSKHGTFSEADAQRLTCNLISALYYLHSNRILHRDLKPQNVLLNEELQAKLCDFGLARNMTMGTHVLTSIKGTPLYMAPELLAEQPYDHQADLWSLGCIAYESMAGTPPFCTTSILHLVKLIKHEDIKWPSFLSRDCRSFLQGLLEKEPTMRISWAQILCHPFVEGKLFIAGIKGDNSPFINPQKRKKSKTTTENTKSVELDKQFSALKLSNMSQCTSDNLTTSLDSINAIPPSDIENIETDVEDNMNRVAVPFTEESYRSDLSAVNKKLPQQTLPNLKLLNAAPVINSQTCFVSGNTNMILNHQNDNFMLLGASATAQDGSGKLVGAAPVINSQTCFVSGNSNMILNHQNDNFTLLTTPAITQDTTKSETQSCSNANVKKSRNKDLEKRKLSQNLDNFSLRLGQSVDVEAHRKTTEMLMHKREKEKDKEKEKHKEMDKEREQRLQMAMKSSTQSTDDKHSTQNSPPCLLPGWDSCDESQSPPIENDEWLAFLHRTMQEVLDGELESLKQHNLVSIIVAPLRNVKAIPQVVDCVAQLLSLPFVLGEPSSVVELIKNVYIDVKLVPNLMYASKWLLSQKNTNDSIASSQQGQSNRAVRAISELTMEEIRTAARLYELICHLVHLKQQFLLQFCDAVAILASTELLISFLSHDFKNSSAVRISNCVLALLLCVLRELPENADLVENVIFSSKLNLLTLLRNKNTLLRQRMCMLFRLLARFSLRGLQSIWCSDIKAAIEALAQDNNVEVREEAESTLRELRHFSFYS